MSLPPFPAEYRASGLLLHVTSLPSPYGIGDVGPAAVAWVDRLYDAGQRWWQALPLGPTGYGDSPYQPLPSFAGNALLISPLGRGAGTSEEAAPALLGLAWSSAAALAIAPLQDVLNLGKEARMNQPGSAQGNWRWRLTDKMLSASAFQSLRDLTRASARTGTTMVAAS